MNMENQSNLPPEEISLSFVEGIFSMLENESTEIEQPEEINLDSTFLEAAAVFVFYDPKTIQPAGGDFSDEIREEAIRELIGCSEMVLDTNQAAQAAVEAPDPQKLMAAQRNTAAIARMAIAAGDAKGLKTSQWALNPKIDNRVRYYLKDDVRRQVLGNLLKQNRVNQALEANGTTDQLDGGVLQQVFTRCLLKDFPVLESLDLEMLNALDRVVDWLSGTGIAGLLPAPREIRRRIEVLEVFKPFKHLTGQYVGGKFVEQFRGRRQELSTLRKYVGVAPPQGVLETAQRFVQHYIDQVFDLQKSPPLLIYGLGGVGKSTLLAKFILEHAEAHQKDRFPFVYLDFDRPHLSALEPETLLIEAARQLSIQYADVDALAPSFAAFLKRWEKASFILSDSKSTESVFLKPDVAARQTRTDREEILLEFVGLAEKLSKRDYKPFLIVLDTFEEVQYKGRDYVEVLYGFISQLQLQYPLLRVVIAGRSPIREFRTQPLPITDLDQEAAKGFLMRLGLVDPKAIELIVAKVGGNPLSLKLAAELVKNADVRELEQTSLSSPRYLFFEKRFSELEVQGVLYRRILAHVHNPTVRKLAHPGLVLRYITPDLILKVLAEPCQLPIASMEEATAVFNEMSREVSLIQQEGADKLKHRPDVRKVMLKLIRESKPDTVEEIHRRAADYYAKKNDITSRAEEFYHRLSLNQSPRALDVRWLDGIQKYLLRSFDELPPKGQAYLSARVGMESDDLSIWEEADIEDQERRLVRKVAELLNSGLPERALGLIAENATKVGNSMLSFLHAKALAQLNRFDEAQETAQRALDAAPDLSNSRITSELNQYAEGNTEGDPAKREEDRGEDEGLTMVSL